MPPRSSIPGGVSTDNIVEGSRKRARNDDANNSSSPMLSSTLTLSHASTRSGTTREQVSAQGFRLLDHIINRIDANDKSPLCIPFLALPSRAELPDYYEQIKTPMSIEQIRRRLLARRFNSLEDVRNALETVWRNAKRYNLKGSDIYEQARVLHSATRECYVDLMEKNDLAAATDGAPQESTPSLQEASEKLAKVETPAARARLDWDEPARGPARVSLRLKKQDDIDYEEDAATFDGSEDEDEAADRKVAAKSEVKAEAGEQADIEMADISRGEATSDVKTADKDIDTSSFAGTPGDNRGDSDGENDGDLIDLRDVPGYDAVTGLLNGNPVDRSMLTLGGKFDRRKRPGPRGKRLKSSLRHQVTELKGKLRGDGKSLMCADFMQLPSQKEFPEYYRVIASPISLGMIDEKAMRNGYANPHGLITDLKLMVDNAKFFNEERSTIWTTADEIDKHIEAVIIPSLLADGFTLDPDDLRQSALPIEYAAVSTIPAHAAAYRRVRVLTEGQSGSPEPSSNGLQSGGAGGGAAGQAHGQSPGSAAALPNGASAMRPPAGVSPHHPPLGSPPAPGQGVMPFRSPMTPAQSFQFQPTAPGGSPYAGRAAPGALPFQRPAHGMPAHGMPAPSTPQGQAPSRALKRLTGEAPPGPYDVKSTIPIADDAHWRRTPVSPYILVKSRSTVSGEQKTVTLLNDLTRVHAVHLGVRSKARLAHKADDEVSVEFRLREVVPTGRPKRKGKEPAVASENGDEFPPWKVSVRYNGRPLVFSCVEDDATTAGQNRALDGKADAASPPTRAGDGRAEVPQGSTCRFAVRPTTGSSVIDITITPSPPDAALAAIVDDEENPHRAQAQAFLQLPEKYRVFIHRA